MASECRFDTEGAALATEVGPKPLSGPISVTGFNA